MNDHVIIRRTASEHSITVIVDGLSVTKIDVSAYTREELGNIGRHLFEWKSRNYQGYADLEGGSL